MPTQQDFQAYHESIAAELRTTQNRIRNLIGDRHWLTDGEHKEAILRNILRSHLPEALTVATGFVITDTDATGQLDILVRSRKASTLFKAGELLLVTPEGVAAVAEVKTSLNAAQLREALTRLADNMEIIRSSDRGCWAGLFVYEPDPARTPQDLLRILQDVSGSRPQRAINCVALGPQLFARFWDKGDTVAGVNIPQSRWHAYDFSNILAAGMAHAYFISNLVWSSSLIKSPIGARTWFPLQQARGKEAYFAARLNLHSTASTQS